MIDPKDFCLSLSSHDVNFYTGVPDSLLKDMCAYVTDHFPDNSHKITANEGSAIGLAIGYYISSKKLPLVYMQNSGLGNAVNPLTSLADKKVYSIPMLLVIGWRGEPGTKDEPQHIKQGLITEELLQILDIPYEVIDEKITKSELSNILEKQIQIALKGMHPVALLIKKGTFITYASQTSTEMVNERNLSAMSRSEFIDYYIKMKNNHVVVATTGVTSRELLEIRKQNEQSTDQDFLTVGGMGHASQIALGIAMNKPQTKIVCLDGDGSLLMHMGSLASIADSNCENYNYILLNNTVHDSVGGQPIGAKSIDFLEVAKSCGFKKVFKIKSYDQLSELNNLFNQNGPTFIEIIIKPGYPSDLLRPEKTPKQNKEDFEKFLIDCN